MEPQNDETIARFQTATLVSYFICITLGLVLNLVVLLSIVTSPEMRSRLRNKLIANLCACHLTEIVFRFPIAVYIDVKVPDILRDCYTYSAFVIMEQIQVFIVNWNLVFVISVLIAEIRNVNLASTWSKTHRTLAGCLLLVLPWVTAMVVVPVLLWVYSTAEHGDKNLPAGCILTTYSFMVHIAAVASILPHLTSVVLMVTAVIMWRRGLREGGYLEESRSQTRLAAAAPVTVYVIAVMFTILCDVPIILCSLQIYDNNNNFTEKAFIVSQIITEVSTIINTLPWFLMSDVRHSIKSRMTYLRRAPGASGATANFGDQQL